MGTFCAASLPWRYTSATSCGMMTGTSLEYPLHRSLAMSSPRPPSHRHALRAALAVTGRARRTFSATMLCAVALHSASCTTSTDKPDEQSPTNVAQTRPAPPVANDVTSNGDRASCVDDSGQTSWSCCVDNRLEADGCEVCEDRFPDGRTPFACLSCGAFLPEPDPARTCCVEVPAMMDELGMSSEDDPLGCSPWGPSAPPFYRGLVTLKDAPRPLPCPQHFRRERRQYDATA